MTDIFHPDFRVIDPFAEFDEVKNIWTYLTSLSTHSFFLSWGWIETWITTLPKDINIRLVVRMQDVQPVFAFFFTRKITARHLFAFSRGIYLNATGDRHYDSIFIEYNSVIVDPAYKLSAIDVTHLPLPNWDEFVLPGVVLEEESATRDFFDILKEGRNIVSYIKEKTYFVNLQQIRERDYDYLGLLSAKRRQQMRRSIRDYEKNGEIKIESAHTTMSALEMLDSLIELHQEEWIKRGKPGAFANNYLRQFHIALIQNRFSHGEIQLLHIYNSKETIGYLYNFVYCGNVLFYQNGFNYKNGNKFQPGIVSLYYAILYNAKENNHVFDFLAGDSPYKKSLSTDSKTMEWVRIQKNRPQFIVENLLKKCKSILRRTREH